jgi:hypothetical protein
MEGCNGKIWETGLKDALAIGGVQDLLLELPSIELGPNAHIITQKAATHARFGSRLASTAE